MTESDLNVLVDLSTINVFNNTFEHVCLSKKFDILTMVHYWKVKHQLFTTYIEDYTSHLYILYVTYKFTNVCIYSEMNKSDRWKSNAHFLTFFVVFVIFSQGFNVKKRA